MGLFYFSPEGRSSVVLLYKALLYHKLDHLQTQQHILGILLVLRSLRPCRLFVSFLLRFRATLFEERRELLHYCLHVWRMIKDSQV